MKKNKNVGPTVPCSILALFLALSCSTVLNGADRPQSPVNVLGSPVRDGQGRRIHYSPEKSAGAESLLQIHRRGALKHSRASAPSMPSGGATSLPFWQYSVFGS